MIISKVTSELDRKQVFQLRYQVYIDEMHRDLYGDLHGVDHESGMLYDDLDETADIYCARDGDVVVGTIRVNWGARSDLADYSRQLHFDAALSSNPERVGLVGKFIIAEQHRGTSVAAKLILACYMDALEAGATHVYQHCKAHLIPLYAKVGWITYMDDINTEEYGAVTPMMLDIRNAEHLREIRSPLFRALLKYENGMLDEYKKHYTEEAEANSGEWQLDSGLHETKHTAYIFDDFSDSEIRKVLRMASRINYGANEVLIREGEEEFDVMIVLEGQAAVTRDTADGRIVLGLYSRGQVLGEVSYLRQLPRTATVTTLENCVVARLSGEDLRKVIEAEPEIAVKLFRNMATLLADRLSRATVGWAGASG